MSDRLRWVLIQHTGWTVSGNSQFRQAVEEASIALTRSQESFLEGYRVKIFPTYRTATEAAERINYPDGNTGLIPSARGSFRTFPGSSLPRELRHLQYFIPELQPSPSPIIPEDVWNQLTDDQRENIASQFARWKEQYHAISYAGFSPTYKSLFLEGTTAPYGVNGFQLYAIITAYDGCVGHSRIC